MAILQTLPPSPQLATLCLLALSRLQWGVISCRVGTPEECQQAPFVPGHNLAGEGFDIVHLRRKGAYVFDVQSYLSPTNSCTLCENSLLEDELQKLPLSILDWRASHSCSQMLFSSHYSSISSLLEASTSHISNDWKVGMDVDDLVSLQLGGTQSQVAQFSTYRTRADKSSFSSHQFSCSHYSYRVSNSAPVSSEFLQHLGSLPDTYTAKTHHSYRSFIDTYGTHVIRQVRLGGKLTRVTSIRSCLATLNHMHESQVQDCLTQGLSIGLGLLTASATSKQCRDVAENKDSITGFNLGFLNHITEVVGGNGWVGEMSLSRNDSLGFHMWLDSLKEQPDVVSYALTPLHKLVSKVNVSSNIKAAIRQYVRENAIRKDPSQQNCGWNFPNLNPQCCPLQLGRGRVIVRVIQAWGLKGDPVGRTEGYVKLWLGNHYRQTHWIKSNNNPYWNRYFDFGNMDTSQRMRLEVWDKDVKYDDRLGGCSLWLQKGHHNHRCSLKRGSFAFSYTLTCDRHLSGPSCKHYQPSPT